MKDHECKFTPIPAKTIDWYNGVEKNLFTTCCDTCKAAGPINIKKKPTLRQIAYVFKAIADHLKDPGSYGYLIYTRLGLGHEAYMPLLSAGGLEISNAAFTEEQHNKIMEKYIMKVIYEGKKIVRCKKCKAVNKSKTYTITNCSATCPGLKLV